GLLRGHHERFDSQHAAGKLPRVDLVAHVDLASHNELVKAVYLCPAALDLEIRDEQRKHVAPLPGIVGKDFSERIASSFADVAEGYAAATGDVGGDCGQTLLEDVCGDEAGFVCHTLINN